ncbi:MAG: hypothetical protein BWK73_25620 [Thiothrix lacustris]|uniref:Uncharacterized protein n=1 Tax=Thiothrix lacustris TaxID=525917 RepID=A0A1Y1QL76_9GAMM|nr:MAG: hypothetical protein BWK73_25620 [Thiothrix lacustris]
MNNAIEQLLAPLEALSQKPKVRLLTWVVLLGNFIGESLYTIVDKMQVSAEFSNNVITALFACFIIPIIIYSFNACKP